MATDFQDNLAKVATAVEQTMQTLLPNHSGNLIAPAMRHATLNGGKRMRAFLVVSSARMFDIPDTHSLRAAAAIEFLHAYSLVHDDLPCMDDDDMRRGQPTVHKKWDDATAVLAGDALLTLAFEVVADPMTAPQPHVRAELVRSLAVASGGQGMLLGQMQDIAAETTSHPLALSEIEILQSLKTGALISWSATAGAIFASQDISPLQSYSAAVGLAFQIRDDILDVEGDESLAGKSLNKDAAAGKATFVSLLGLEEAKSKANLLIEQAEEALHVYGDRALALKQLARFAVQRKL